MKEHLRLPETIVACLFDLDGVLTHTAELHAAAWKQTFDAFLKQRTSASGGSTLPFDAIADYDAYVDGKPRADGVRSFLAARGIELPEGSPDDLASAETVNGLARRKNELMLELMARRGVTAYDGSVRFLAAVHEAGLVRAVVTSSENAGAVLRAAGLEGAFDIVVDGTVAHELGLAGKPAPDVFLEAARRLGVEPRQAAVFEDALAGVAAGRAGGFGLVVGIDRAAQAAELQARGADLVVADLADLIAAPAITAQHDPWAHRETAWSPGFAAPSESLLALSNGYLGLRGTLDEGEPAALAGTYLNGFYETRPMSYPDRGYADPEFDQVLVGVADGTRIRLEVEGEPLDVRAGTVGEHERVLDLRGGLLTRTLRWRTKDGDEVRVRSRRLVSLTERELAAIEYEVEPTERPLRLAIHSELIVNSGTARPSADPRSGAVLQTGTLVPRLAAYEGGQALLVHETRFSRNVVAAGMDHVLVSAPAHEAGGKAKDLLARWSLTATAAPGQPVRFVKLLAYRWAPDGDPGSLADQVRQDLARARGLGFDELSARQRAALDHIWAVADIEVDGDPEIQHALRYALFQLHQNTVHAAGHAIPAKGLTGPGYNGHTFWDTEIFLLQVLIHCAPRHVDQALRWRASTLPKAQARARRLGLRGAAFPWRTVAGDECSGYLPAGTAAFHINADIAHAVVRYIAATGDDLFEREAGAPLLVETARLWTSLGYHDERRGGRFSIDGVTGPDEYSVLVDNNLYTNLMAQANLRAAADLAERLGTDSLGVEPGEIVAWRRAAEAMTIPYDPGLGVHLQDEDFTRHARFDFEATPPEQYPLLLHVPYFQLYRKQVVKQPDLVLAMALHGDAFSAEEKQRNFAYYEALTVRDSSLAAGTQSVLAAEVGDVQLAYDYLAEAALLDHQDIHRNTSDGLHLAALAGGWIAVISGLAGARQHSGRLSFSPRLPQPLQRIAFPFSFQGRELHIEITPASATYRLRVGAPLEFEHWGTALTVTSETPTARPIPPPPPLSPLRQPAGRAPRRRWQSLGP